MPYGGVEPQTPTTSADYLVQIRRQESPVLQSHASDNLESAATCARKGIGPAQDTINTAQRQTEVALHRLADCSHAPEKTFAASQNSSEDMKQDGAHAPWRSPSSMRNNKAVSSNYRSNKQSRSSPPPPPPPPPASNRPRAASYSALSSTASPFPKSTQCQTVRHSDGNLLETFKQPNVNLRENRRSEGDLSYNRTRPPSCENFNKRPVNASDVLQELKVALGNRNRKMPAGNPVAGNTSDFTSKDQCKLSKAGSWPQYIEGSQDENIRTRNTDSTPRKIKQTQIARADVHHSSDDAPFDDIIKDYDHVGSVWGTRSSKEL